MNWLTRIGTVWTVRLFALLLVAACGVRGSVAETLRIGVQKTGTFSWQLDVIRRHHLAETVGLDLEIQQFASPDAGKLAINSGAVDIAVADLVWTARERALGRELKYYPYSTAVGAVMVKAESPLRELGDLRRRTLAVAGGALDKSWLIVLAAAKINGIDLKHESKLMFGAPPLLYEKFRQGEADANLNFWNFCARLEAQGFRKLLDVRDAQAILGLKQPVAIVGYVFAEGLAQSRRGAVERFLTITRKADQILLQSDSEWEALRPLMNAENEAVFLAYRTVSRNTIPHRSIDDEEADARLLFTKLAEIGGPELVGPSKELGAGLYFRPSWPGN